MNFKVIIMPLKDQILDIRCRQQGQDRLYALKWVNFTYYACLSRILLRIRPNDFSGGINDPQKILQISNNEFLGLYTTLKVQDNG